MYCFYDANQPNQRGLTEQSADTFHPFNAAGFAEADGFLTQNRIAQYHNGVRTNLS